MRQIDSAFKPDERYRVSIRFDSLRCTTVSKASLTVDKDSSISVGRLISGRLQNESMTSEGVGSAVGLSIPSDAKLDCKGSSGVNLLSGIEENQRSFSLDLDEEELLWTGAVFVDAKLVIDLGLGLKPNFRARPTIEWKDALCKTGDCYQLSEERPPLHRSLPLHGGATENGQSSVLKLDYTLQFHGPVE